MAAQAWGWLTRAPSYPATEADRREIDVFGLRLPWRATLAIVVATLVVVADASRTFFPDALDLLGRTPFNLRVTAIERLVLYGLVPLAVVTLVFRDRPSRYGLALGEWRTGLGLMIVGCAAMTPLVLWFATMADVQVYYAPGVAPLAGLLLTNVMDLASAEFLFRGFLTFVLLRAIGPVGVLVATMPFIYAHLGKPELEVYSTLAGGLVYGWLAWRTRSIVWGTIGHVYIMTLVIVAAAAAAGSAA